MDGVPVRRRSRWAVVAIGALTALTVSSAGADAAGCRKVTGKFTVTAVTGGDCASVVGFCTASTYRGDLTGSGRFTGTSQIATADTPTTGVVVLTGDQTLTTKTGDLLTKDAVVLRTTGSGEFAAVDTVVGGTGQWAGFTGTLRAHGTFTQDAGGSATYVGELCSP